jgi:S1-C subfamily serine protease
MKIIKIILLIIIPVFSLLIGCAGTVGSVNVLESIRVSSSSIVRVNITRQEYNLHRPWQQKPPVTTTAIGVVIKGNHVLVTSELIADHRYIELEKIESGKKADARVDVIDYEANLALISPNNPEFLEGMQQLELTIDAVQGDRLEIWQVQNNGNVTPSHGPITSIELINYPSGNRFLAYRMNNSLQYRFNNFTLPVVFKGKLAGLLMRYDPKAQTVDVVAAPVINHFLNDALNPPYKGFPIAGIKVVTMEDPQLRRYVGIREGEGGVYLQKVVKGSGAEKAGLKQGDIITQIGGFTIDSHGNYEHPIYGKVSLSHLTRCRFNVGENVPFKIFRKGKQLELKVAVEHRSPEDFLVPPYIVDRPPRFFIFGGMVLQELSIPYLLEYGSRWSTKAPPHLVQYARNEESIDDQGRRKIVFLSSVLPTSYTIGYERLSNLVVTHINDQVVKDLDDVPEALKRPVDGFHKIEFKGHPRVIFFDPKEITDINRQLRQRYNIKKMHNLD